MKRASLVSIAATILALFALSAGAPGSARADDPDLNELQATLDQSAAELDVAWMQSLVDHGQYDAALDALDAALASAAKIKAEQPRIAAIASAYAWSARAALAKGELDRAADFYRKALLTAKGSEAAEREIAYDARVGLGWIALAAGDQKSSVERFNEAGALLDKQGRGGGPAATPHLLGLARANLAAGDLAAAQRALDGARSAAGPAGEADVLRVQSLLSLASGDAQRAQGAIARVFAIEDGGRLMREIATNPFEGHNLTTLGRLDGDLRIALSIARVAGDSDPAAIKSALTAVLRRKGLILEATAARQAAVLRRAAEEPALAERLSQLAELQRELAEMERKAPRGDAERAAYAKRIAEIEDSMDHRRSAISLHLPVGAGAEGAIRRATAVTIEQIQAALPPDGALIEIARYAPVRARAASELERWDDPRYCAFLLKREGAPKLVDLGPADAIEDLIASLRSALASRRGAVREPARALDALTMAKLRPHFGGVTRAWIAPDGALHTIPFEALIDEGGHYQVESLEITYLGTGRDLARRPRPLQSSARR